jgi:glycerol uptake facilitator-like aquaporin
MVRYIPIEIIIAFSVMVLLFVVIPYTITKLEANKTQWDEYIKEHPELALDDGDPPYAFWKPIMVIVFCTCIMALVVFIIQTNDK